MRREQATATADADERDRAIAHDEGPLLVAGAAGTGKTELLARRLARLAAVGTAPERVLVIGSTRATARRLRERAEALLTGPFEELWIGSWDTIGERLLREHAEAAGLDPFFDVLGPAERLAMLLDRLDQLPLRRHEIRGNPTGLLARLLARIDRLKAEAVGATSLETRAREREQAASDEAEREGVRRDLEFAELFTAHDRILAGSGSLDRGDVFLALNCLLIERPDIRRQIAERFEHLMVDELEESTASQRAILEAFATDNPNQLFALEETGPDDPPSARSQAPSDWYQVIHPAGDTLVLKQRFRDPQLRFWKCTNERAQAQAVAREVEHLVAGGASPEGICVLVADPTRQGGAVAAAMEERSIPFHLSGPAALFQRPEVRDAIAWLRVLAAPDDSPAAARALTRPPIELRPGDLARLTTIARRRKQDLVAACEAALDSPQFQPEARERIQAFVKLYNAASAAMEERRADVFVRRLIERVGLRRQRLFAAQPEVAERLLGLSRLAELATAWTRREPHGSTRGFVAYLSAVAEAGVEPAGGEEPPSPGSVQGLAVDAVKGIGFDHVFVLGLEGEADWAQIGWPARSGLVLSWVARGEGGEARPSSFYEQALAAGEAGEEEHGEELFGPAEGLHATYRTLREQVLEASWRAGRELSEPRLDTAIDVNRAIARYLELLKLAALAQRPGDEPTAEAIEAVNGLLRQVATPEQQAELDASSLDSYLLDSEDERGRRRELIAAREEPSLAAFLPRRGDGKLSLSASDLGLYLTCPLKYKFARVFGIPQEPTINQRFGILIHNVLERFHKEPPAEGEDGLVRLNDLFETGWRRTGFDSTDDELQFRDRAREALRLYWERERVAEGEPVWLERKFDFKVGDHHVRGRVDRVDRLPDGDYELIDYKTGERKTAAELENDLQLALYRLAARKAWDIEASLGSYYYVLDADKVATPSKADDAERVERTVLEVGAGILDQDFEPRPSPSVCGWCDYRLICPAAES
ncbi:MAG TPA: ATP-dependent DNA helicase [Solirubrobacterales bacterium]|jgi:DNA helicase-2/ATP-dependent DNA helicase PcrA|nr:ATP-dependent DNA helicase [Solirubrobacterales bacterium]